MKYRNIIFDFDGTLADTSMLILATMKATIRRLGWPERSDEEYRAVIGYRLEEIPSVLWPDVSVNAEKFASIYRDTFKSLRSEYRSELYPHILETLQFLHTAGVNMAIASSRSSRSLREMTDELGIAKFFQLIIGGDDVAEGKPAPEPVNKILGLKHWHPEETLVVGDMDVDILMGQAAGTDTCAVCHGNGTPSSLRAVSPTFLVPSLLPSTFSSL